MLNVAQLLDEKNAQLLKHHVVTNIYVTLNSSWIPYKACHYILDEKNNMSVAERAVENRHQIK